MNPTRWSRRSARKALRRDLRLFDARLPSTYPGIAFTARITARVVTEPPFPDALAEEIATDPEGAAGGCRRHIPGV